MKNTLVDTTSTPGQHHEQTTREIEATMNPGQRAHLTKGQLLHLVTCDRCEIHMETVKAILMEESIKGRIARLKDLAAREEKQGTEPKKDVTFGGGY